MHLSRSHKDGLEEFEVKWKGFSECTWEPVDSFIGGGEDILKEFRQNLEKEDSKPKRNLKVLIEDVIDSSEYEKFDI